MRAHLFLLAAIAFWPLHGQAAGFERAVLASTPPIEIGIWYPSASPAPEAANTPFRQALAIGGAVEGDALPLIVLSHGNGGWMGGHSDTALALAKAGYVAVALTHPGDNSQDQSASPGEWLVSRPADISKTLEHMLSDWAHADRIDANRIGVFGFSAGGYAALVAAGAFPDFSLAARHCATTPQEYACRTGLLDDVDAVELAPQLRAVVGDARIAAASVAAPGFGYSFDREALADVVIPVQIWSGASDDSVPHDTNGATIAANLPTAPEVHIVENAGHFAFLVPCDPRLETAKPNLWRRLCVDADGFDRAAFHETFNRKIVAFFDAALMRGTRQ